MVASVRADRSVLDYPDPLQLKVALGATPENGESDWELSSFDKTTSVPQTLQGEFERLSVLQSYEILESEKEVEFELVTTEAKEVFDVPIAVVSLIDLGRQWFKSIQGLDAVTETPRCISFCTHVVQRKDAPHNSPVMVIPDATQDERFKNNPFVTDGLKVRFYAGAPLVSPEGPKLGTLCLLDTKPRPQGLSATEQRRLQSMANEIVYTMITRLDNNNSNGNDDSLSSSFSSNMMLEY